MKEVRLLLAFTLSLLVLFIFNLFFYTPPSKFEEKKVNKTLTIPTSKDLYFENESLKITFSKEYGFIKEIYLKKFSETLTYKNLFFLPKFKSKDIITTSNSVIFKGEFGEIRYKIKKYFLTVSFKNLKDSLKEFLIFEKYPDKEKINQRFVEVFYYKNNKLYRKRGKTQIDNFSWGGIRGRYFCLIFEPDKPIKWKHKRKNGKFISTILANSDSLTINCFIGPQIKELLKDEWQQILYYGFFSGISKFILKILSFLHSIFKNWGLSIIVLTVLIYIILFPFTIQTTKSTLKMQEIQPEIERLKKQYKDNLQKLNKELLELYRKHKINPLSGCLPLFFQIPVFIGLYQALMRAIELKGAKFLWIKDLSLPDRTITIGNVNINVLPILTALLFFFQQKFYSTQTSSEQKKFFEIFFPLFFAVIFYSFPSGFLLYWLSNSILTLLYYLRLKTLKNL